MWVEVVSVPRLREIRKLIFPNCVKGYIFKIKAFWVIGLHEGEVGGGRDADGKARWLKVKETPATLIYQRLRIVKGR